MARPKPDTEAIRRRMIAAAEQMLEETNGRRLILSDVARRVGLTQSHAHSFFATKADLVRALAMRWFESVENAVRPLVDDPRPLEAKLQDYILRILHIKREKFDANPLLFRAYLALAEEHRDIVQHHAQTLRDILCAILSSEVPQDRLETAADLICDATVAFRVPHMIAMMRPNATDARAKAVITACMLALQHGTPRH